MLKIQQGMAMKWRLKQVEISTPIGISFLSFRSLEKAVDINRMDDFADREQEEQERLTKESIMRKIKECLDMADEVQKYNIKLREENKEIREKYEKERAKVFQLNMELEKRNNPKVNKINKLSRANLKLGKFETSTLS
jgi:hypothetical protein